MRYISVLAVFIVSLLVSGIVLADSRVDANTVLLLTLDEGSGDTANDSSGNGNHGLIRGPEWVEGVFGTALEFVEDGDGVTMPISDSLDLTEQVTIEAWLKPASLASRSDPISKHQAAGYALLLIDRKASPTHHIAGAWVFGESNTILEEGKWYYIAATFDGQSLKTYINGELDGETEAPGQITSSPAPLGLGGVSRPEGVTKFFYKGVIDEVRISNIARTVEEIRMAMNPEEAPVHPSGKLAATWAILKAQ